MDGCKETSKPIILSRGTQNRKSQHVELVPIFLEQKNQGRKLTSNKGPANAIVKNVSVDIFNEHKLDNLVNNMKEIESNLDREFENLEYKEIIVTVEDDTIDQFDFVQSKVDLENIEIDQKLRKTYEPNNPPEILYESSHPNSTIEISESVPKSQRETYKCGEHGCVEEAFSSYRLFRDHYILVHGKFPLECLICGKRYKEKHSLQNHLEMHSGEEKYPCEICSKRFKTKERLLVHKQLHQGRRFICECGFKARCQRSLRKHIGMKHGQRKFGCTICRKTFASRQNLEAHSRIHTGETPWKCYLCGSKFNRLHHFRQHLSTNMHVKRINDLIAAGGEIPDLLNPEKNVARRREIIDQIPEIKANGEAFYRQSHFQQNVEFKENEEAEDVCRPLSDTLISLDSIDCAHNITENFAVQVVLEVDTFKDTIKAVNSASIL